MRLCRVLYRIFSWGGGDVDACKWCMRASMHSLRYGFVDVNEIVDIFKDKKRQIQLQCVCVFVQRKITNIKIGWSCYKPSTTSLPYVQWLSGKSVQLVFAKSQVRFPAVSAMDLTFSLQNSHTLSLQKSDFSQQSRVLVMIIEFQRLYTVITSSNKDILTNQQSAKRPTRRYSLCEHE